MLALSVSEAVTQACLDGDPAVRQPLAACALKRALHVSVGCCWGGSRSNYWVLSLKRFAHFTVIINLFTWYREKCMRVQVRSCIIMTLVCSDHRLYLQKVRVCSPSVAQPLKIMFTPPVTSDHLPVATVVMWGRPSQGYTVQGS